MANRIAGTRTTSASLADRVNTSRSPRCRSCQADTASITAVAVHWAVDREHGEPEADADSPERRAGRADTIELIRREGPDGLWQFMLPKLFADERNTETLLAAAGGQLRLAVDHRVADRVLHPRVGRHDEQRRQRSAERDRPDGRQVHPPGQLVPAEQPQAQERRLQEERGQPFHGQRGAEDVADEPRVGPPVHPELELLHQPGHHADCDVDHQ